MWTGGHKYWELATGGVLIRLLLSSKRGPWFATLTTRDFLLKLDLESQGIEEMKKEAISASEVLLEAKICEYTTLLENLRKYKIENGENKNDK